LHNKNHAKVEIDTIKVDSKMCININVGFYVGHMGRDWGL